MPASKARPNSSPRYMRSPPCELARRYSGRTCPGALMDPNWEHYSCCIAECSGAQRLETPTWLFGYRFHLTRRSRPQPAPTNISIENQHHVADVHDASESRALLPLLHLGPVRPLTEPMFVGMRP